MELIEKKYPEVVTWNLVIPYKAYRIHLERTSPMWDEEYSVDEYVYGTEPNDFLLSMTEKLKKGRVLCLAEGEGRNAVHLAKVGFTATAVDSSRVGLEKAEGLAQKNGVAIETILVDLADFAIVKNSWDSIISISCHLPPDLRKIEPDTLCAGAHGAFAALAG